MPSSIVVFFILFALFLLAVSRRLIAFDLDSLILGDDCVQCIVFGTFRKIMGIIQSYHCSSRTLLLLRQHTWKGNSFICIFISSILNLLKLQAIFEFVSLRYEEIRFLTHALRVIASWCDNKLKSRLVFLQEIFSVFGFTKTRLKIGDDESRKSLFSQQISVYLGS